MKNISIKDILNVQPYTNEATVNLYMAGSLLNLGSKILRQKQEELLKERKLDLEIYNPTNNAKINDKRNNPTADDIFTEDISRLLASDVVIADITETTGTTFEMGMLAGIAVMQELLDSTLLKLENEGMDYNTLDKVSVHVNNVVPNKRVYWFSSNINSIEQTQTGFDRSYSINQLLYGGMRYLSNHKPFTKFEDIVQEVADYTNNKVILNKLLT